MSPRYERNKIKEGYSYIIGCDEVGKGSLAGPVVAAAVTLPVSSIRYKVLSDIKDSKLLLPKKRIELSKVIKDNALAWSVQEVSPRIIDRINIHRATLLAMKKAFKHLCQTNANLQNVFVYVDGQFKIPECPFAQEAVVDGDSKVLSIAAASILAKVYRDNLMVKLHKRHPLYNFAQHKGYGTLYHRQMIIRHGLSSVHRLSFCGNLLQV